MGLLFVVSIWSGRWSLASKESCGGSWTYRDLAHAY